MSAALRIVVEVVRYRLARLEMANLVASVALVLALRLSPLDAAVRVLAALVLNVLAYLSNDYHDVEQDLVTGRAPDKTRFLAEHLGAALSAQIVMFGALVLLSVWHEPSMLVGVVGGAGVCWFYSWRLKRRPGWDVASMVAWGALMPAVAVPLARPEALGLLVLLGLFSSAFELVQVLRDRAEDEQHGVRTTAVALGERGALRLLRLSILLVVAWTALVLRSWGALVFALAWLLPYTPSESARYWTRLRLVFGIGWLLVLGRVLLAGPRGAGVLGQWL